MKSLDVKLLKKFLTLAGNKLSGEWLLLGGTLLPACGVKSRPTVDIDIVAVNEAEASEVVKVMEICEELDLPVTTVNQAANFFLEKTKYKRSDLIRLHKGKSAEILRPTVELYWKLKVLRLTEADYSDCLNYYDFCIKTGDKINKRGLRSIAEKAIKSSNSTEKINRLKNLVAKLR